ncbi:MAG: LysM peptidoglycan-binding domain-containing protein [Alphaproteobacteria bacterium]
MNRSAAAIGIGVLAIAAIVGVILFLQLPSPDTPPDAPAQTATTTGDNASGATSRAPSNAPAAGGAGVSSARRGGTGSPATTAPVQGGGAAAAGVPSFDVVRVDKQGNVVIAGKSPADCKVTVRDGETIVGTATADRRGDWVIVPGEPLAEGESQLSLSAKCGDAVAVEAEDVVVVIVPKRGTEAVAYAGDKATGDKVTAGAPAAESTPSPSGAQVASGASGASGGDAIAVAVPRDVSKPSRIIQSMSTGEGVVVDSVDYDEKGEVIVSGQAEPGSTVQVYLNNRSIGTARADASGRWRLVPEAPVAPGKYALRADMVQPDGKVVARTEIPFVRGEPLGDLPEGRVVVIQPGDYLWKIARARYGSGVRYTLIYEANRGQIRNPDLIYPGQVFTIPQVN